MKAISICALAAAVLLPAVGYGQLADRSESGGRPTASDITRGRLGGDATRSSTGVVISGANANLGAGSYNLMGATSEGTIPLNATATAGDAVPVVSPVKKALPAGSTGVMPRMDEEGMDPDGASEGDLNVEGAETQPVFSGASTTGE